jgi:hypothetical protein
MNYHIYIYIYISISIYLYIYTNLRVGGDGGSERERGMEKEGTRERVRGRRPPTIRRRAPPPPPSAPPPPGGRDRCAHREHMLTRAHTNRRGLEPYPGKGTDPSQLPPLPSFPIPSTMPKPPSLISGPCKGGGRGVRWWEEVRSEHDAATGEESPVVELHIQISYHIRSYCIIYIVGLGAHRSARRHLGRNAGSDSEVQLGDGPPEPGRRSGPPTDSTVPPASAAMYTQPSTVRPGLPSTAAGVTGTACPGARAARFSLGGGKGTWGWRGIGEGRWGIGR